MLKGKIGGVQRKIAIVAIALISSVLLLTACGGNVGVFDMDITLSSSDGEKTVISAAVNESVIGKESWVLFELRTSENNGPIWIKTTYKGNGVFSGATTEMPTRKYELYGHYYAGGGMHVSKPFNNEKN
ncbi:hypothetical protein ACX93W_08655 [Paenibacillus sp. CAU 1782]